MEVLLQRKFCCNESKARKRSNRYLSICDRTASVKPAELVPVLKSAYGIDGARGGLGSSLRGYMTSGNGIELLWTDATGEHEATLTWNKVASILLFLIRKGVIAKPFPLSLARAGMDAIQLCRTARSKRAREATHRKYLVFRRATRPA